MVARSRSVTIILVMAKSKMSVAERIQETNYAVRGPMPAMIKATWSGKPFQYRVCQIFEGKVWKSEPFTAQNEMDVRKCVTAGFLIGVARWAEDMDGLIMCGYDGQKNSYPLPSNGFSGSSRKLGCENLESIRSYYTPKES